MQILLDSYIYSDFIPILIQIFDLWIYISDVLFIILITFSASMEDFYFWNYCIIILVH